MPAPGDAARLVGLIPSAGRGVRAYPYTATIPKSMLEVDGVPLIQRNVELMRDQLGIRDIVVVVGYRGEVIRHHLGDGSDLGVRLAYVDNPRIDLNLPYSVFLGGREIRRRGFEGRCCVILADECYVGSNHRDLLDARYDSAALVCGMIRAESAKHVRKNYIATIRDGRIVGLEEKPRTVVGSSMGTGTYLLDASVLERLAAAFGDDHERGPRDWTSWLGGLCAAGLPAVPFPLAGRYVNVNSRDDLAYANYLVRDATFGARRTSLVYVLSDERASIEPVTAFAADPQIDEVLVVSRRTLDAPAAALGEKTRVVAVPAADGIGTLVRCGLDEARGDRLLLCYSDDTFVPTDVGKFLVYLRDADMVVGTRTTRQMIEQGANMRGVVRAAHVTLAKVVELLWWKFDCRFTDICCVYRALWRSTYRSIRGRLRARGPEVFPEMVIEVLRSRRRIIEIPVNYWNPDPDEPYVTSRYQSVGTFLGIVRLIVARRVRDSALGRRILAARRRRRPVARDVARDKELERQWQDEVGYALLDQPHSTPGSAAVFTHQAERLLAVLAGVRSGLIVEVGCGKGHFLERLRDSRGGIVRGLVGIDLSRAVMALPAKGLAGVRADGEFLPFRDGSVAAIVYDGALHHIIDYPAALREANRVLAPDGLLLIHEPVTSWFSRLAHRLLDPIIFRKCVYESPIDIHYKHAFREEVILDVLRGCGMAARTSRSDFLAYPLTGCYASSVFARREATMRRLLDVEERLAAAPVTRHLARQLAWRFTIVARKELRDA